MHNNDEIDLIELFIKLVVFVKSKFKAIVIALLIGGVLGSIYYFVQPSKIEYTIFGYTPMFETGIIVNCIDNFNSDIKIQEKYTNSKLFAKVKSIEAQSSDDKNIEILVSSKSEVNIDTLSSVIKEYMLNNAFINKKIGLNRKQLQNSIEILDKKIEKVSNSQHETVGTNESSIAYLLSEKNKHENDLAFLEPFIITNTSKTNSVEFGLLIYALLGSVASIFLLLAYYMVKKINSMAENAKDIKEYNIQPIRKSA